MPNEDGRAGRSAAWGAAAAVSATGAFTTWPVAVAPKSTFPIWPTYTFAAVATLTLYMCFATIWGWRPTGRSARGPSTEAADLPVGDGEDTRDATTDPTASTVPIGSTTVAPPSLPPPPVSIKLKPELDVATNRIRLGALNRGELGRFRVEVVDSHDQDGNWVGPRSWPLPWLDGSVGSTQIPMFGKPLLDFAHFDFLKLREDLEGTKWLKGDH